jgi:hypothetical protein
MFLRVHFGGGEVTNGISTYQSSATYMFVECVSTDSTQEEAYLQ